MDILFNVLSSILIVIFPLLLIFGFILYLKRSFIYLSLLGVLIIIFEVLIFSMTSNWSNILLGIIAISKLLFAIYFFILIIPWIRPST
ncbi:MULTISPECIES: hypothetical protein [Bacillaceae]|uniref:NADH dehydrogenase subunit 4L n=1 Tax=Evansella alkalicola TaxID=745819 RepID=A0ABS6JRH8_9BACI|nr:MULTISPECIES: hypothetical protein [Bacillaceae]MBU9719892.1 hypothetical protein [Bacillus alkalicola]